MSVKSVVAWCATGVLLASFVTAETATPAKPAANTTVKGQYKGRKSGQPVPNTLVALCRITGEWQCVLSRDLVAVTDSQGRFVVRGVPAGRYTVARAWSKMPTDVSLAKPLNIKGKPISLDGTSPILKDGTTSMYEVRDSKTGESTMAGNSEPGYTTKGKEEILHILDKVIKQSKDKLLAFDFEVRDSKLVAFDIGGNVSEIEASSYNE